VTTPVEIPPSNAPVVVGAEESLSAAKRVNPGWQLRFGVVRQLNASIPASLFVELDNDTAAIPAISLIGRVTIGDRVSVITVPPSGNYVTAVVNNPYPRLIARAERFTSSTGAAGAQGVLRLDAVAVPANHLIVIDTSNLLIFSTVAGDTGSARIAYTTDGTTAGTGSTLLTLWNSSAIATTGGGTGAMLSIFLPILSVPYSLSALLFTLRITGTGLISLFASAGVTSTQLRVWDWGPAPADTGVII
jgi:hypothetical protein